MDRVLVIGIDGLGPHLLEILVRRGVFPNIKELRARGAWGELRSTLPPVTAPAWATFATGVNPGKHGIYDFALPRESLLNVTAVNSREIAVKTFYELLEERGRKCILVNLPLSWPPLVRGPVITGLMTRGGSPIFPRDLVDRIPRLKDYRLVPSVPGGEDLSSYEADYVNDIRDLEKVRFECARELLKLDWDFFFLLFSGSDWLSHYRYHRLIEGTEEREVLLFFRELDDYVGELTAAAGEGVGVFLLSDHGFRVRHGVFHVNAWLSREGWLKRTSSRRMVRESHAFVERPGGKAGRTIDLTRFSFLLDVPVVSSLLRKVYGGVKRLLPVSVALREAVDPPRTAAFSPTHESWGVYVNCSDRFVDGFVDGRSRDSLVEEIRERLRALEEESSGKRVLEEVFLKEELYHGGELDKAPDLLLVPARDWSMSADLVSRDPLSSAEGNDHDVEGIFIAWGPDIVEGKRVKDLRMEDVAPTLLHVLGGPLYAYMDGRVRKDLFRENSAAKGREHRFIEDTSSFLRPGPESTGERELVRKRIRDLKREGRL